MGNIVIATPELSDAAVLTSTGSVAPTLPLANLQDKRPSKVCRWLATGGIRLTVDLGRIVPVTLVALLFTNLSADGELRVLIADTEGGLDDSSLSYDSGWYQPADPAGTPHMLLATPGRWVAIEINDATNPDGFIEAGRLYVAAEGATCWQPEVNGEAGWQLGIEDDSQVATARDGGLLTGARGQRRVLYVNFECQSEAELYGGAFPIMQRRGLHSDVLAVRDPDAGAFLALHTVYGLLGQLTPVVHREADLYGWSLTVREMV